MEIIINSGLEPAYKHVGNSLFLKAYLHPNHSLHIKTYYVLV
jgi:hypothetical protein